MREIVTCLFAKENSLMTYGKLVISEKDSGLPEPFPRMRGCEIWGKVKELTCQSLDS